MDEPKVVFVMLRQPRRSDPDEARTDPLWEFGSFGCTGCHRRNLMNPRKLSELNGVRLAFAQNGPLGIKLVHVTPPISVRYHGAFGEAKWTPAEMPLTYAAAPTLANNLTGSDIPPLLGMIEKVRRNSPISQFASKFRSSRTHLPIDLGRKVLALYTRHRRKAGAVSRSYIDALPYPPPRVDGNRKKTYRALTGEAPIAKAKRRACSPRVRSRCR